ncbi:hypothetical protein JCM3775_004186 [Rhodotorula graminis]|uniref:Uncharacterized protein n=1 Tax=Rhodotorula graminis (strain WP1) TaxID=578459 RepID=A0A194SBL5_RHOGW|nr:uncharacterized protein RHOBADRAFT_10471 [Rhodotorula graminis WP1]KPV77992.1 hypothetical protein RHOBADRAFT_10471 [Rhodotorula graminis WP1]
MALAPQFATHRIAGSPTAAHTLELFLDIVCPFSRKQLQGVRDHLVPLIDSPKLADHLSVIVRQVPQPWHASSTLVHEAALAASKVFVDSSSSATYSDPDVKHAWKTYFYALIDGQDAYYDEPCATESPNDTRARLADLAASTIGVDRQQFLDAISVGKGNGGTPVTADLKLQIKFARARAVHVTPTVFLDGLAEPSISSSFSGDDWRQFVNDKVLPAGAPKL